MTVQDTAGREARGGARRLRRGDCRMPGTIHHLLLGMLACSAAVAGATAATPAPDAANAKVYHTRFRAGAGDGIREVEIEGRVRFSEDESRVEWMGDGAHVRVVTEDAGRSIRFEITADGQGRPVARIAINGRERALDADFRQYLADTLPVVFRELGHDAEARVRRAREQGGPAAVIGMITGIRSVHSKRLHYEAYLDLDGLSDTELNGVLSRLGTDLGSDTELASFLYAAADLYRERPGIRGSYLACLAAFGSAAERARITHNLFGVETIGAGEQPALSLAPGDC